MVSPDLKTPYMQQWSINAQWEFRTNWLLEVGYVGSKGSNLLQFVNQNQALDIDATRRFLPRPGVPGGGFTGNYYDLDEDEFVNLRTPPPGCICRRSRRVHRLAGTARSAARAGRRRGSEHARLERPNPGTTRCRRASRSGSRRATCST